VVRNIFSIDSEAGVVPPEPRRGAAGHGEKNFCQTKEQHEKTRARSGNLLRPPRCRSIFRNGLTPRRVQSDEPKECNQPKGALLNEYDRIGPDHPAASAVTSAMFRAKNALGRQVKKGEIPREQADELTRRYWKLSAALSHHCKSAGAG
jgi:hypothetical protein